LQREEEVWILFEGYVTDDQGSMTTTTKATETCLARLEASNEYGDTEHNYE
jgi:hypothetical protein